MPISLDLVQLRPYSHVWLPCQVPPESGGGEASALRDASPRCALPGRREAVRWLPKAAGHGNTEETLKHLLQVTHPPTYSSTKRALKAHPLHPSPLSTALPAPSSAEETYQGPNPRSVRCNPRIPRCSDTPHLTDSGELGALGAG